MMRLTGAAGSVSMAVLLATAGCSAARPAGMEQERSGPVLAVRMANYGPHQEKGWSQLQSLGVGYVFMNVPAPDQVEATRQKLAAHGLTPVVMRGETNLSQETAVDELAVQLATCREMGVRYMFLSPKRHDADKQVIYDRLRSAGEVARSHGVTIVLETHPDLGTNADVHLETMRAIDHPNVRVNFDTANIYYYNRDTDARRELREIIEYVATVEVKDSNRQFETWHFPALGRGDIDLPGILAILKEYGYRGPITIEVEGIKGIDRNEQQFCQDVADSVQYMRTIWPWGKEKGEVRRRSE